jgi:hypothetical protein
MASILKVDDLRGNTAAGNITITSEGGSATMQLQQGVAKQWCHFDGTAGTLSLDDSLNTASLTDSATGIYLANFTNNMSNTTYFGDGDSSANRVINTETTASSSLKIRIRDTSDSAADAETARGAVLGDLA